MVPVVTAAQMRALEEATERAGTSVAVLMQRAGEQLAREALASASPGGRFQVVCGTGNNGGDGMVAALRLFAAGRKVAVRLVGDPSRLVCEPSRYWAALLGSGLSTGWADPAEGDVVVDALFGTGLNRAPSGAAAEAIDAIGRAQAAGAKVVSADIPSGLPSDGGAPFEPHVRADLTVTFGAAKLGCVVEPGVSVCGALRVVEIGLVPVEPEGPVHPERPVQPERSAERGVEGSADPRDRDPPSHTAFHGDARHADPSTPLRSAQGERRARSSTRQGGAGAVDPRVTVWLSTSEAVRARVPVRRADSHKGTYGHVLVVAGSAGKTGAAALCALGALRAGAGLVTVAARPDALPWIQLHAPEIMGFPLEGEGPLGLSDLPALVSVAEGKHAQVVGPGIPRGEETAALLSGLLAKWEGASVLDADALNALAPEPKAVAESRAEVVLTPHPGEMARLCHVGTKEIASARLERARALSAETRSVVLLKGARTVIARPDGTAWINPTGNAGMATGGTGDVLSGICGGLLAQGLSATDAGVVGAFVHGAAGDRAALDRGQSGLIASDLLDGLGALWAEWGR